MYDKCDGFVSKNGDNSARRTLVILVLFSVTLSALGISCFALLTVQKLSQDLNALKLVLSKTKVETAKQPAYGFINNVEQNNIAPIYEVDGKTEEMSNSFRFKRGSIAEKYNSKANNKSILNETILETISETSKENSPRSFDPTIQPLNSDENIGFPSNKVNKIGKTQTENSEFLMDKREEFETTSEKFFETNKISIPSVETVKIISNSEDIQKIEKDYNKSSHVPNPLKKDVEIVIPGIQAKHHKLTEHDNVPDSFILPRNPNIPSIIEDAQNQMDHHVKKKAVNYEDVESFTPEYSVPRNVYRHRQRDRNGGSQLEIIDEFSPQAGRLKSLMGVHLDGDTSQYQLGIHTNYKGNGHLRHAQKTYVDWKMSDWVETINAGNSFHLKNGVISAEESGLYFIYAQIYYLDEHDSNGFIVRRNSENILHCKVTAPSSERAMKGNTCYTGAVVYLDTNDKISLEDIFDGRYTLFKPGYSFFGMIKFGDIKGK